ncbi:hypothetical protein AB4305_00430 [Nocardia sp. 2YAB30]|uniref:hypothetical protein n=1 Tax=Nocardia sp. 2YAB30 TaxID=3233022 RepID=UPI003F982DF5
MRAGGPARRTPRDPEDDPSPLRCRYDDAGLADLTEEYSGGCSTIHRIVGGTASPKEATPTNAALS